MAILSATGRSKHPDAAIAVNEAVTQAMSKLGNNPPSLALVFASVSYDQQRLLSSLRSALPAGVKVVGCSDAGEITENGPEKKSIALMLLSVPTLKIYTAVAGDIAADAEAAGRDIATQIQTQAGGRPKVFFMMPDGLVGDGAAIVKGVQSVFGSTYRFVGGSAGDDFLFRKTYQYHGETVYSGTIVAVGIDGDIASGIGVRHGWKAFGITHKVTKAKGNIVYEIDHLPAISIYEEYFGKENSDLLKVGSLARLSLTYPLGMQVADSPEWLIRDPLSVDDNGAITCAAAIPQGAEIQIMLGGKEEAIAAAEQAASQAMSELGAHVPKAIINFNCIARSRLFGLHASDETQAIINAIGPGTPLLGFYTYGEQAPLGDQMKSCQTGFHNETAVILVLGE